MTKDHMDQTNGVPPDQEHSLPEDIQDQQDIDLQEEKEQEETEDTEPGDAGENPHYQELMEAKAALGEIKDKHLRLLAEFDNFKKRTMRERLDLFNTASKDVMVSLLPVLDDFDRAKKSADDPATEEAFSEGVTIVYNRLYQVLLNMGLKVMTSTGETFDPELHEAITEIPVAGEDQKGKVIDTVEKGYFLHDKIIRHAKVVVGN